MRLPRHPLLRAPVALALGGITFWLGLAHLVRMSTSLTGRVILGETPYQAITALQRKPRLSDAARDPGNSASSPREPADRGSSKAASER